MQRRDFFKFGARKAASFAAEVIEAKKTLAGKTWLRPPFALDETDFLAACTKCDDCITACEFNVIFKLPDSVGSRAGGTPALDLLMRGCHMCEDWPCVTACEPNALKLPDAVSPPKLATAIIDTQTCLPYAGPECGACADSCPIPGALIWNGTKPEINADLCTGCAMCREACITEPKSVQISA
jgi:ferredoxin-type protein NapG